MKIIRSATAVFLRTRNLGHIRTNMQTAEMIESMTPAQVEAMDELADPWLPLTVGWSATLYYEGRCWATDAFRLTVSRDGELSTGTTLRICHGLDIDARDRERVALARANRAAGVALSVGGAQ